MWKITFIFTYQQNDNIIINVIKYLYGKKPKQISN